MVVDGVMLLWFILTALSVGFVAIDIRRTPESAVMKWGSVLITLYSGPFGAFLYVLGCREPLPGLHERFSAARWRQVLGSTMHCVAGDGLGILTGSVIASLVSLSKWGEFTLEYVLGFGFGWTIFQALFMRSMAGGSYARSLRSTLLAELLSMNCLMAGMLVVSTLAFRDVADAHDPTKPLFWFRMSLALMTGFLVAYPMNWWLVTNHLKHGMTTVRRTGPRPQAGDQLSGETNGGMRLADHRPPRSAPIAMASMAGPVAPRPSIVVTTLLSFVALGVGLIVSLIAGGMIQ